MAKRSAGRKSTKRSKRKSSGKSAGSSRGRGHATTKRRTTAARPAPAKAKKSSRGSTKARGKVGASRAAAKNFASKGDFGVPVTSRDVAREVSEEAKHRPAGDHRADDRQPRSGVDRLDAGVGMRDAGPGSDSGGDVDPSFVGLPEGRGIAQAPPEADEDDKSMEDVLDEREDDLR